MTAKDNVVKRVLRIEPSQRWVRAQVGGEFVVDSKRPLLVWEHEKYPTYFFPPAKMCVWIGWKKGAKRAAEHSGT